MRSHFNVAFMVIVLILIGYLTYQIFAPFLVAIFLAFIFSHLFKNWYEKLKKTLGGRKSVASFLTCLLIFLLLVIPTVLVSLLVISEINQTYQNLQQSNWDIHLVDTFLHHPLLERLGIVPDNVAKDGHLSDALKSVGNFMFQAAKKTYQSASHFLFMLVVMFFTLYYFFKDGQSIEAKLMELSPLKNSQERLVMDRFLAVSKATIKGSLVIAAIQGLLQGMLFFIVGVPSPAFWGVITLLFAMIPMLGAAVVWLPAGIILLATGNVWQGVVVLASGALVVSTIDNFLRPALVGNQAQLHPLLVFFSTLGGIALFGLSGVLLGPIVVALFITLLGMYRSEFKDELKKFNL